ncbi:MAG: hypothetical protein ACNA7E_03145 [Wenzhouxiangellaceae bacterium]
MNRLVRPALAAALLIPVLPMLSGCDRNSGCGPALEAAAAAADQRLPLEAWIDAQPQQCRAAATARWDEQLAAECAPLHAFHAGRGDREMSATCEGVELASAWNLGQMIGELEGELGQIRSALEEPELAPEARRDLRQREVVIERDLPQLQALARFDGLLPAAEIPDAPEN